MSIDDLLTPSELRYVMDDIKTFPTNLVENSAHLFNEESDVCGSSQIYDTDNFDTRSIPKRKRPRRMCDSTYQTSSSNAEVLPCLESYPGKYDFQLQLPVDNSAHRWTYSEVLKKVFIDIDKVLALQFKWNYCDVKPDREFYVRAMPVYTSHDSLKTPVVRCPIHLLPDNHLNIGFHYVEHVMRCEHSGTSYMKDEVTKRLSCITPLSRPQAGSETTTLTYKFVCKTSCLSGMNRKPISVVFTLEDACGNEYGRQLLAVKVCSCPKRDKVKEEKNELDKTQSYDRILKTLDSTPNMICVRNAERDGSASHTESLRDIKSCVSCNRNSEPSDLSNDYGGKDNEGKEEGGPLFHKLLVQMERHEKVIEKFLQERESEENKSYRKFGHYVESQLDELSAESALDLQNEIFKVIHEKKLKVLQRRKAIGDSSSNPELSKTAVGYNIHAGGVLSN